MEQEPRNEIPELAEKVRFWQEQDRINQVLIPRVLRMHEQLTGLGRTMEDATRRLEGIERTLREAGTLVRAERVEETGAALERLRAQVARQQRWLVVLALLAAGGLLAAVVL